MAMVNTSAVLRNLYAGVTEKIYNNMGHTINRDEMDIVNKLIFDK